MSLLRLLAVPTALGIALAGCASEPVYLRNMAGQTVQCGPYHPIGSERVPASQIAAMMTRDCISDFQRQGYERVPTGS
jgi:hypothetical protein